MNKNKKTLKNTETYREIILVCDYCGKKQPNNNKPCSCGYGSFWVTEEDYKKNKKNQ